MHHPTEALLELQKSLEPMAQELADKVAQFERDTGWGVDITARIEWENHTPYGQAVGKLVLRRVQLRAKEIQPPMCLY